jgi:hypothetical protein
MRWFFILAALVGVALGLQHYESSLHLFKKTAFVLPVLGIHIAWAWCLIAFVFGLGAAKLKFGK